MKLKTVEINGKVYAEVDGDRPLYVHDDGKETPFDAPATVATISRLNGEAKNHRERAEAAEGRLKSYEGIEDAEAAKRALDTVKNLKDGELVTAGKVEEIKAAAKRAAEEQVQQAAKASTEQLRTLQSELEKLTGSLYAEKIGGAFSRSKFISEKVAVPGDLLRAQFERHFKVEDGKTVAYDPSGSKIYSRTRPGELAEFDEALEQLVDAYPYRDSILKGSGSNGGGSRPGNGSGPGVRQMTRAQFDAIPAEQRAAVIQQGVSIHD